MKIFLLDDPAQPGKFARFSHVGTWTTGSVCEKCGLASSHLIEPLQIEWDPGTERIGDFSWCGYECVVREGVRDCLEKGGFDCDFGLVEIVRPTAKAKMPRVPYPYSGPPLSWLMPNKRLSLDEDRSGVKLLSDCAHCGQKDYSFKREDLVIDLQTWSGERIFRIEQFGQSNATFVTELGLGVLLNAGFSNLCPRIAGKIECK